MLIPSLGNQCRTGSTTGPKIDPFFQEPLPFYTFPSAKPCCLFILENLSTWGTMDHGQTANGRMTEIDSCLRRLSHYTRDRNSDEQSSMNHHEVRGDVVMVTGRELMMMRAVLVLYQAIRFKSNLLDFCNNTNHIRSIFRSDLSSLSCR